ncbi:Phospholipase D [Rhynchospora pubera]|uniref:Phospholipase D n=1 Tax=Rhynchospora pubera TaxID=906938 RepID=A0AAV8C393_9POAL|nr:Phospholipase D [Rhynchospora pubera]
MSTDLTNEIQESDTTPNKPTHGPCLSTGAATDVSTSSRLGMASNTKVLHGDLDIWIHEARCLPNMDIMSERMRRCFTGCKPTCMKPSKHRGGVHKIITSDPYVSVCLSGATIAQTRVIPNSENPKWEEHFVVNVAHPAAMVEFQVKDNDLFGAQLIGIALVPVENVMTGETVKGWFPLMHHSGEPVKAGQNSTEVQISLQYKPIHMNNLYSGGVGAGPNYSGVPNAYFPLRKGGKVTLYQDAHVMDNTLPKIELEGGTKYEHNRCWEDICHSILEAHHLIYVVGWSVYHQVKLVREPTRPLPNGGDLTLGEMLKFKTQEGVRVVLLIWDDKTSHDKFYLKTNGIMHTHDEETRKFFKNSSVHCVLAPRYASTKLSIFKQQVVGTLFTHHQKCVIVDTPAGGNNRKLTAFIGGLDICDGRYDTPEHRLFKDLGTVFKNDIHNPTFTVNGGPRQPWHDLHCKIEGPAAYDILTNFEQRWRKATKWKVSLRRVTSWTDDTLIKVDRISWILSPSNDNSNNAYVCKEEDPENWHVQVFRSIDSGSVKGFPKEVQEAETQNLVCAKNLKIDRSIHTAYVKAIRAAQHFIYIENQYFIGSSYCWPSNRKTGADNLIPIELALKIVSKIKARERFSVYIVIPMWPEGNPTTAAMQEILFWQGLTMKMMYKTIANALEQEGLSETHHPQDYLNFYCLGKRESSTRDRSSFMSEASTKSSQKFRRFMIYVHSKGMVVDDEFVLIGSANINQRSLEGSRDTEIAMGAYQPHHTWARKHAHPHGQVYGYRMSLWAEHLGSVEDCFAEPQCLKCVRKVNEMAEENWLAYVSPEIYIDMQGHLLKYPIRVDRNGKVGPLQGFETFPDVGGKVLGSQTSLPDVLTT